MFASKIQAVIFLVFSVNLFASITLTIRTSPGTIPSDIEWDMPGSNQSDQESIQANSEAQRVILGMTEE